MSKISQTGFRLSDYTECNFSEAMNVGDIVEGAFSMNFFHWHRHYEIFRIFEGSYTIMNNRTVIRSDKPAIIIHKPFTLHNLNSDPNKPYVRRFMNIRRDIVHRFIDDTVDDERFFGATLIYAMPDGAALREIDGLFEMADCVKNDEISAAHLAALVVRRTMLATQSGCGEIVSCSFSYIQNVLTYIADNLSEPCSIAEIAERFGVKRSKFQADFREVTGVPYHQYLSTLRLTRSRELLLQGKSLQKTAMDVGYNSEAYFIKVFREYFGITPGETVRRNTDSAISQNTSESLL